MILIPKLAIIGTLSSGVAFAGDTENFRDLFEGRFIGASSSIDRRWDLTYCIIKNPITGVCSQKGGFEIHGRASGSVTDVDSFNGRGVRLNRRTGGWDNNEYMEALMDVQYTFNYSGTSSGKKQCYPGNFHCGYEWGNLHPTGKIHIDIIANPGSNFGIDVWYEVQAGHDDKPNSMLKDAMKTLESKAVSILRRWRDNNDIRAEIEVK